MRCVLAYIGFSFDTESDSNLTSEDTTLVTVMNNFFWEQQSRGMITKMHNTLSNSDILRIFRSVHCDPHTSIGFCNLMVLTLGLCPGGQTASMWLIKLNELVRKSVCCTYAWVYTGKLFSDDGAAKCGKGDILALKAMPVPIPIYEIALLYCIFYELQIVKEYMRIRCALQKKMIEYSLACSRVSAAPMQKSTLKNFSFPETSSLK